MLKTILTLGNIMRMEFQWVPEGLGSVIEKVRSICLLVPWPHRALFVRESMRKGRKVNITQCLFHQSPGGPNNEEENIGYCNLNKETKCSGNIHFCKTPEAVKTYLRERGLAWRNERAIMPQAVRKKTRKKSSADTISQSIEYIQSLSKLLLITIAFAITITLGMFNRLTGLEGSSYIFYLIPISLVTWFTKQWAGLLMSIICALTWFIADSATMVPFSFSRISSWNAIARLCSFIIFTCILWGVKKVLEKERESSRIDYLTGVRNRKYFIEQIQLEILQAKKDESLFTVVYIDLDNFKLVNDRFGHIVGDNLLRFVSKTIKNHVREIDTVARLGGDEFAILLPEAGSEVAELITQRIQKKSLDIMQKYEWPVTFSIGAATFASPSLTVDEVLKKSDDLMYAAKRGGKNTIRHEVFAKEGVSHAMVA